MFENQSNAKKAIDAAIRKAISTWIPDITIDNINITALNEDGTVGVSLNIILPDFTTTSVNILSTVLNPDGSTSRE
jgi:phage baseplate assembly protein W